ncbi:hypothetical protein [Streptomyces sp. CB03234]|uniref:hypothetical protein n=1 Tax=Streptomyces sp. (strain CB03234) TaxID=1703937 RepID=UPI001F524506|nr:hypothetical protein [Streptomyces sp. CB03234]
MSATGERLEPQVPECARCGNRRGPWRPDPYGAKAVVCAAGCPAGTAVGGPPGTATTGAEARARRVDARKPVRMCVRCDRFTTAPVLVSEVHSGSGPGFNVYACCDCAPLFPKLPDALDLLASGRHDRAADER